MDSTELHTGLTAKVSETVSERNTARALGSGGLDVYATPAMVALMEKAALSAVAPFLPEASSTVGTKLDISHVAASPLGIEVFAQAELTEVDGRRLVFKVRVRDTSGPIGEGTHERVIIDNVKFMAKTAAKKKHDA
jgi:predicted thioesterase